MRIFGGVTEIRTRDTLLAYTRFPGVPLQPLEHHSKISAKLTLLFGNTIILVKNFFNDLFFGGLIQCFEKVTAAVFEKIEDNFKTFSAFIIWVGH